MSRLIAWAAVVAISWGCTTGSGSKWQREDGTTESATVAEQRAKDIADCATRAGAPTPGTQSTLSTSRGQVDDCMRGKGWRKGSPPGE